jgi:hypothetical protein
MKTLATRIERELQIGKWNHYAAYEDELQRIWPLNEKHRNAKLAQFAQEHGLRLRFYRQGLCAIFDKDPSSGHLLDRRDADCHSGSQREFSLQPNQKSRRVTRTTKVT